ncbi:M48 family metallopeptidase [Candidatus Sumerlaeota bacterium]|nr:M48 family metallopeptidase [Candidatus Sumerlaeota bacterium]
MPGMLPSRRIPFCLLFAVLLLSACSTVPISGRRQINLISSNEINSMSFTSYKEFLGSHQLSADAENAAMVKKTGRNIQLAVEKYFVDNDMSDRLDGYEWEFNLLEEDTINAWCMPGGKVVVYSGILPLTRDETGLAVVLGHEIAHAVANHGNERMSQGLMVEMGGAALSQALEEQPEATRSLFLTSFGLGAQVGVVLPYSRLHENEADHLGLIFMAMAGYDPREAVDFWKRMAAGKSGATPEFLSTHPSDQKRIDNIKSLMPEALKYYKKS